MSDVETWPEAGAHESTATVVVRSPGRTPLRLVIGEPVVIGRECDGLLIDDPLMSRRHLEVKVEAGAVVVTDLGSTNGTTIDGRPVSGPERVGGGAVVGFGSSTLEVLDRSLVGAPREV